MAEKVLVLQTGGTIDKCYPKTILGYSFEIGEPAVSRVLDRAKSTLTVEIKTVCRVDSQDISQEDRTKLAHACRETDAKKIMITHGTDTMVETARMLSEEQLDKIIVLTGSFLPETFKNSDADFNIGFAFGCLQTMTSNGVYLSMNGCILPWSKCGRDSQTNMFGPAS
ncbi:probable L-asparaginase periplasmic [Argopecten irradians]|uniref:probable L-asparaginase periplasmic n=1 Tax=Argopecten irradians TaxID=31199 RepID=UPI0037197E9E